MIHIESYWQTVLDNVAQSIWMVGLDYKILLCNEWFCTHVKKLFGYDIEVGSNAIGVQASPETIHFWKKRYDACFEGNALEEIDTYSPLNLILKMRVVPIYKDSKVVAALCFSSNIKEAKDTEAQLLRIQKEIAESQHKQAGFLSKITHELRTPLNGIMGLAHLLLHENPTAEQTIHLKSLIEATEQLSKITQQTLDIIDFSENKVIMEAKEFSLHALFQSVVQAFEPLAKAKNIVFTIVIEPTIQDWVSSDNVRITQVLEHLLQNALKFTEKGDITLAVQSQPQEVHYFTTLRLSIKDTGCGIAPNKLTHIFEVFQPSQENKTPSKKGLGLPLVHNLLDKLGGHIQVKSVLGEGTEFICDIPLQIVDKQTKYITPFKKVNLMSLVGLRILFVEDNILNQRWTGKFLQNWHITVDYAANGRQAVEKVQNCAPEHFYHLILMDIEMPELNGFEATRRIRQYSQVPIIALTASPPEASRRKALASGMNDFVSKPFSPELLHEKIIEQTAYPLFSFSEILNRKQLANFDAVIEFADGDLAYQHDFFNLYKKFFVEFPSNYEKLLTKQDLDKLYSLAHKSRPSMRMINLNGLETELNQAITALENNNSLALHRKRSISLVQKYCALCLTHLSIYVPQSL